MSNEQDVKVSEEFLIDQMQEQFDFIAGYNEVLKDLKSTAKEAGFDGAILAKVAKARSDDKVAELKEKTEKLQSLLSQE